MDARHIHGTAGGVFWLWIRFNWASMDARLARIWLIVAERREAIMITSSMSPTNGKLNSTTITIGTPIGYRYTDMLTHHAGFR
jgi:hypothetical protein